MSEEKDNKGMLSLDEVLAKQKASTRNFIEHLEQEDAGERIENVDSIRNQMKAQTNSTNIKKNKFIEEMKNGLGTNIKENKGYGVKIHKPTKFERISKWFKNLYSKF